MVTSTDSCLIFTYSYPILIIFKQICGDLTNTITQAQSDPSINNNETVTQYSEFQTGQLKK